METTHDTHTLHVWTCNDFTGHWPVPTAAVVVAHSEDEARALMASALREHGLTDDNFTVSPLPLEPGARVLSDGEY